MPKEAKSDGKCRFILEGEPRNWSESQDQHGRLAAKRSGVKHRMTRKRFESYETID